MPPQQTLSALRYPRPHMRAVCNEHLAARHPSVYRVLCSVYVPPLGAGSKELRAIPPCAMCYVPCATYFARSVSTVTCARDINLMGSMV